MRTWFTGYSNRRRVKIEIAGKRKHSAVKEGLTVLAASKGGIPKLEMVMDRSKHWNESVTTKQRRCN